MEPFDPRNPYFRRRAGRRAQGTPTLEDYHRLSEAYRTLQAEHAEMARELAAAQEALRQQAQRAAELEEALHAAQRKVAELEEWLAEARERPGAAEEAAWRERYLRLQAELDTYRRRLEERSQARIAEQQERVLQDMLSLADHLEMALQHLEQVPDTPALESYRTSLEATLRAFLETLRRYGVEPLSPQGEPFDPTLHEAVGQVASDQVPPDHVAQVVRTGYRIHDRLLRPARVLVSRGKEGRPGPEERGGGR